jgi:hypothetical protein
LQLLTDDRGITEDTGRSSQAGRRQERRRALELRLQPAARIATDDAQIAGLCAQAEAIGSNGS